MNSLVRNSSTTLSTAFFFFFFLRVIFPTLRFLSARGNFLEPILKLFGVNSPNNLLTHLYQDQYPFFLIYCEVRFVLIPFVEFQLIANFYPQNKPERYVFFCCR